MKTVNSVYIYIYIHYFDFEERVNEITARLYEDIFTGGPIPDRETGADAFSCISLSVILQCAY